MEFVTKVRVVPSIVDPFDVYYDNKGTITQAKEPMSYQHSKHILIRFHPIKKIA